MKTATPAQLAAALCLTTAMTCGTACGNDSKAWEAYEEQLCEMMTDSEGNPCRVVLDNGITAPINLKAEGLTPDSTYRALALFSENDETLHIYNIQQALAPKAKPDISTDYGTDAIKVLACWRSRGYINLRIAVERSHGHEHLIGFADDGAAENHDAASTKTQKLRLLHDAQNDRQDFSQEMIVSCPTSPFQDLRNGKDSLQMTVHTTRGDKTFTFLF